MCKKQKKSQTLFTWGKVIFLCHWRRIVILPLVLGLQCKESGLYLVPSGGSVQSDDQTRVGDDEHSGIRSQVSPLACDKESTYSRSSLDGCFCFTLESCQILDECVCVRNSPSLA